MEEVWRKITGYNYSVSNKGNVRNDKTGRILKPVPNDTNHMQVSLFADGKRKNFYVHRLVGEAFIPNPDPEKYTIINHLNEDPSDNSVENLEWCDYSHNINYGTAVERASENRKWYFELLEQEKNELYWALW